MSFFDDVYKRKPIDVSAARGLAGLGNGDTHEKIKTQILINTDRLPDNAAEQRVWEYRQWLRRRRDFEKFMAEIQCLCVIDRQWARCKAEYLVGFYYKGEKGAYAMESVSDFRTCPLVSKLVSACRPYKTRLEVDCAVELIGRILNLPLSRKQAGRVGEVELQELFPEEYKLSASLQRNLNV